jgi:hypothetical protein
MRRSTAATVPARFYERAEPDENEPDENEPDEDESPSNHTRTGQQSGNNATPTGNTANLRPTGTAATTPTGTTNTSVTTPTGTTNSIRTTPSPTNSAQQSSQTNISGSGSVSVSGSLSGAQSQPTDQTGSPSGNQKGSKNIAGIVVGTILGAMVLAAIVFAVQRFMRRRRRLRRRTSFDLILAGRQVPSYSDGDHEPDSAGAGERELPPIPPVSRGLSQSSRRSVLTSPWSNDPRDESLAGGAESAQLLPAVPAAFLAVAGSSTLTAPEDESDATMRENLVLHQRLAEMKGRMETMREGGAGQPSELSTADHPTEPPPKYTFNVMNQ